jgi:carbamate kinase
MVKDGWEIILTHGNGPQVGALLLQQEMAKTLTPAMPLGICVAQSQGQIGYMIQQCMTNALKKLNISKNVVTLVSQVIVNDDDPAFDKPSKPVGPVYEDQDAIIHLKRGYPLIKQKKGWRLIVPSPQPVTIVEAPVVKRLLEEGNIVIAAGGGGMPVVLKDGKIDGREAVVDKDLASERLATEIGADLLLILTDVPHVYLEKDQIIQRATLEEMEKYYQMGFFPPGSMGPKIFASIQFLKNGGKRVAIASIDKAWQAAKGKEGTQIIHSGKKTL